MGNRSPLLFCIFLGCLVWAAFPAKAQNPPFQSYNSENGLPGNEVYSILQDNRGFIYLGCDGGLFKFDGIRYHSFRCSTQKSYAVSGLTQSNLGPIFCYNFQSQIFCLDKDTLSELKYTFSKINNIACDNRGNLIVNHNEGVSVYDIKNKHWKSYQIVESAANAEWENLTRSVQVFDQDKMVFITSIGVGFYDGNSVQNFKYSRAIPVSLVGYLLTVCNNQVWLFSVTEGKVLQFYNGEFREYTNPNLLGYLKNKKITHVKTLPDGNIWICTYDGVIRFDTESKKADIFFKDYSISDVIMDREQNYWFTTLQSSVLFSSHLENLVWTNASLNNLTRITGFDEHVFVASNNGLLGTLDIKSGEFTSQSTQSISDIQCLHWNPEEEALYFYKDRNFFRLHKNKIESVWEDAPPIKYYLVASHENFAGTSIGLFVYDFDKGRAIQKLNNLWTREMRYDEKQKTLFAATNNGLYTYAKQGVLWQPKDSFLMGNQLISIDLDTFQNRLFAVSYKGVVYSMTSENVWTTWDSLPDNTRPNKIKYHNQCLYLATNNGIWIYELVPKRWKHKSIYSGLASANVQDIYMGKEYIYAATGKGLQRISFRNSDKKGKGLLYVRTKFNSFENIRLKFGEKLILYPEYSFYSSYAKYEYLYRVNQSEWTRLPSEIESIEINNLPSGNFTIEVNVVDYDGNAAHRPILLRGYMAPPFWRTWWFISCMICLLAMVIFLIVRQRFSKQQRKWELESELNKSKLTAIQSQMNPHFIFNSLNSIQDLILKGEVENSYTYLSTFSDLVRKTLSFSDKEFIDFDQEVQLLSIYLSLEKLRFKDDFTYEIIADDVEDIMIPPLLVQPFVENALLHGLLHKEGEKTICIRFELNDYLICMVEDNGIGRVKSQQMRERQGRNYESFSGTAIQKRFKILSHSLKQTFHYKYEDLETGTRVVITIPVKRKF